MIILSTVIIATDELVGQDNAPGPRGFGALRFEG
jgi:hypothetical protein